MIYRFNEDFKRNYVIEQLKKEKIFIDFEKRSYQELKHLLTVARAKNS